MSDITIVKERGFGRLGTFAKIIPHNQEALQILKALISEPTQHYTISSELSEEMAETLREKGLTVDVK